MAGVITFIETGDINEDPIQVNLYNTAPIAGGGVGQNRPVTSVGSLADGRLVAGIYYITFSAVTPGVSGTVVVDTSDSNNPWKTTGKTVLLDDDQTTSETGTMHDDVIGGVGMYFSNSGSFTTSWTATVIVGGYFSAGTPTRVTAFGSLVAGTESAYKKIGAKNTGDANCEDCAVGIYPGIYFKNTTFTPVYKVKVNSKAATAGKYVLTLSNFGVSGADVAAAWYTYNYTTSVWDLASPSTDKGTFACDNVTAHTTIINGVDVTLSVTVTGGCTAAVYVDQPTGAQIAPDISNAPGDWVSASDVTLTENGGGTAGLVQPGNVAYFWLRVTSSISDKSGNIRKFSLRPSGSSVGQLIE